MTNHLCIFVLCIKTQPCYWRNSRDIVKRDISSSVATVANTTLSENLSLFQAIQVIADDETSMADTYNDNGPSNRNSSNPDHICLKPVAIGAVLGTAIPFFISYLFHQQK